MNLRYIWLVFVKEMSSTLRDRRTLFGMILVPVLLMPIFVLLGPTLMERQVKKMEEQPPRVAVLGEQNNSLVEFLRDSGRVELVNSADPLAELEDEKLQAVIAIPVGLDNLVASGGQGNLRISFDASNQKSSITQSRLHELINLYIKGIVAQRLQVLGLDTGILEPVTMDVANVAPEEKVGGSFLGLILPLMMAVWAALGGMYAAIDAAASEKERGTLEPLLATPISRTDLVLGKYLTVVLTSVLSAGLSLVGMFVAITAKPNAILGNGVGDSMRFSLPFTNILIMMLIVLTLSGIFSALQLCVSAYARNYREANTYLSPLSMLVVIPGVATQFLTPGDMPGFVFMIPLLNAITVFKELLMGTLAWDHVSATLLWSLAYIFLALRLTIRVFSREEILFRI